MNKNWQKDGFTISYHGDINFRKSHMLTLNQLPAHMIYSIYFLVKPLPAISKVSESPFLIPSIGQVFKASE